MSHATVDRSTVTRGVAPRDVLLARVGDTPLVELTHLGGLPAGTRLFAKLETTNPTGSVKDRPVARMLVHAIADGHVGRGTGRRLLDSSSGNAGIAYAALGALLGVDVTLVVPGNASKERLQRIRAHGAELVLTDPIDGYDAARGLAGRMAKERPDLYWYSNQYANEWNWRAHHDGTAGEVLRQLAELGVGAPELFVSGVGTGGTLTGVGRRLRSECGCEVGALVPDVFPGIEGLKPLGAPGDRAPELLDEGLIDHRVDVRLEEALPVCGELARAGMFCGPSSGGNVYAARTLAHRTGRSVVVTLLCDTGERYLSTGMWSA
ncbi:MAG: cysteine synthase family protein [Planctomycetota bacterium]